MPQLKKLVRVRECPGLELRADCHGVQIERAGQATVRVPLQRISTLVLEGNVALGSKLLRTLADAGVSVVMADAGGRPVADVAAFSQTGPDLTQELDQLMAQPRWRAAWECWREKHLGQQMAAVLVGPDLMNARFDVDDTAAVARVALRRRPLRLQLWMDARCSIEIDARDLLQRYQWPLQRLRAPNRGPDATELVACSMEYAAIARLYPYSGDCVDSSWFARERGAIVEQGRRSAMLMWRWMAERNARTRLKR